MLADYCATGLMRHMILRYFNVAGCDPAGRIGHSAPTATLLIKAACEHAVGKRDFLAIYGTDYDTPDGTGIRDYIHVDDLAAAHLRALDHLRSGGTSLTLNCGYGHGYSVREVLDSVARVGGQPLNIVELPRREGDLAKLIACSDRLKQMLDWQPQYDDLDFIVRTALAWERKLGSKRMPLPSVA
jgi:UDP-glucose 4-epimerase